MMDQEGKKRTYTLLIVFAGSMMVAHGLRMMIQGLLYPSSYYPAPILTSLDFWFDWFTLSFIGIIIFLWGLIEFYRLRKARMKSFDSVPVTPT